MVRPRVANDSPSRHSASRVMPSSSRRFATTYSQPAAGPLNAPPESPFKTPTAGPGAIHAITQAVEKIAKLASARPLDQWHEDKV